VRKNLLDGKFRSAEICGWVKGSEWLMGGGMQERMG